MTIRYTDSSILQATIVAPRLLHYSDEKEPYTEMPEGVKATFFDARGRETSRISAASAVSYETEKMIVLRDSVRVYNTKGEELQSEELYWDQRKKTIYTNTFVKIVREGETLRGHGFESNETFTKYKILKPSGPVKLKESFE